MARNTDGSITLAPSAPAQGRQHSEKSVTSLMSPAERNSTFNAAMFSCLRSFGYEIRG